MPASPAAWPKVSLIVLKRVQVELLKAMSGRLRGAVRETDLVARLGGDEFVVVLEGGGGAADISGVAHKMLAAIGQPLTVQGCGLDVTGSIGIGVFPADGEDGATLLKHADAAMYLAKERGKNNIQFYTTELADLAALQFAMEVELRSALVRRGTDRIEPGQGVRRLAVAVGPAGARCWPDAAQLAVAANPGTVKPRSTTRLRPPCFAA
jgi:hypothetical protein